MQAWRTEGYVKATSCQVSVIIEYAKKLAGTDVEYVRRYADNWCPTSATTVICSVSFTIWSGKEHGLLMPIVPSLMKASLAFKVAIDRVRVKFIPHHPIGSHKRQPQALGSYPVIGGEDCRLWSISHENL